MKPIFVLLLSLLLSSSVLRAADRSTDINNMPWDIAPLFMHYLPLQDQLALGLVSKNYWNIFADQGRRFGYIIDKNNAEKFLNDMLSFPKPNILFSLTIEQNVQDEQVVAIFEHIIDFGLFLEAIDIKATITDEQLLTLLKLPRLAKVSLPNIGFSNNLIKIASLPKLRSFCYDGNIPTAAIAKLLANTNLELLKLGGVFPTGDISDIFTNKNIVFNQLHTLSLKGSQLPCTALYNLKSFAPNLQHLELHGLTQGCAVDKSVSANLLSMNLDTFSVNGQGLIIPEGQVIEFVKHFPGYINFNLDRNGSITGRKKLQENNMSQAQFSWTDKNIDVSWIIITVKEIPHQFCSFSFPFEEEENADGIKQILGGIIDDSDQCDVFNLNLSGNYLNISRRRENAECKIQQKLHVHAPFGSIKRTFTLLPASKRPLPLGIFIMDVDDFNQNLHVFEIEDMNNLYLSSKQSQTIEFDTLLALSKNGALPNLQLHAKGLKFGRDLLSKAQEIYEVRIDEDEYGTSLSLHKNDHQDHYYKKPINFSVRKNFDAKSLRAILAEKVDFFIAFNELDKPIDPAEFEKIIVHPWARGFSCRQTLQPFKMTKAFVDALKKSTMTHFHINAPKIEFESSSLKKTLKTDWQFHSNGQNHDFNRINKEHGQDRKREKTVSYGGKFDPADLPLKKNFTLVLTDTIDVDSLMKALTLPNLVGLHISAKDRFYITPEFINAISENGKIAHINIGGNFIVASGALKDLSGFQHVAIINHEKSGEGIYFDRIKFKDGDKDKGISVSINAHSTELVIGIETLMDVISIPGLKHLCLFGNINLNERAIQLLTNSKTLTSLTIGERRDFTFLMHLPTDNNLEELNIFVDGFEVIPTQILPCIKRLNLGKVIVRNFSHDAHLESVFFTGHLVSDALIRESMCNLGRSGEKAPAGHEWKLPDTEITFFDTAITGEVFKDLAQAGPITKLDLSGSNKIMLEHVKEFARVSTSIKLIVLPVALADELNALSEEFPHIKFVGSNF